MRISLAISAVGHTAFVLWGVLTFAGTPHKADSTEAMPVDVISATDFSQLTAGNRNAPKAETAKPLVDKVGERKPVEDPTAKVEKKEIAAAIDKPPPAPEPKPPAPVEKKPPEPKRDLIADAIKKDQVKKAEPKKAEAKAPTPPKKEQQQPKFDPKRVEALLDKRAPQRLAATGDAINDAVSLGTSSGLAAQLSQSELDAFRARLANLWNPPAGASSPDELLVRVRIRLNPDGRLAGPPFASSPTGYGNSALYMAARDSAHRAINRAQPFDMFKPENYEQWKDIEITFDPRDMIRG